MPIYEEEGKLTREDLLELRKRNKCKECGGMLNVFMDFDAGKAFLACSDWHRSHHEGIEREASRYEKEGLASLNIPTRREIMEKEYGEEKTTALEKARLPMTGALTQPQAMRILKLVYPDVPEDEVIRTAILCRDFGLHPLMKEVYIIGFLNHKTGKTGYSTVIGITASRKMAADRKGAYSFLDGSPRAATPEEIVKQYGKNSEEERDNLISICILKGERGNEAIGFGLWPKNKEPHGTDKGNTKRNMANIRSERPAYSRLPGAALPPIEVIDEAYTELPDTSRIIDKSTGEIIEGEVKEISESTAPDEPKPKEHWCEEHNCPFEKKTRGTSTWYAHKLPDGTWCNEGKKKESSQQLSREIKASDKCPNCGADIETLNEQDITCPSCGVVVHWRGSTPWMEELEQPAAPAEAIPSQPPPEIQALDFDPDWLFDSLRRVKWTDTTVKSYCLNIYKVNKDEEPLDTKLELIDFVASLKRQDREALVKEVQDRLQML